jgi:hypothetical protein
MSLDVNLQAKIINTLIYFDVLSIPLTAREVYRWLPFKASYREVLVTLKELCSQGEIATDRGFYFLAGRIDLVRMRLSRYSLSLPKLKRAWIFTRIISYFPWVEGVVLYSSTSFFNTQETSDLDFFIVTSPGRVWSGRFWINVLLKLFGLRPNDTHKANTFCVSFLVDRAHLELGAIAQGGNDEHYLYGTSQFIFLSGDQILREDFFVANTWIANRLPQWHSYMINNKRYVATSHTIVHAVFELFCGLISEQWYRRLQMYILPDYYKKIANLDTRVMLSDHMIKLHHRDGRDWIAQQLKQRRSALSYENIS